MNEMIKQIASDTDVWCDQHWAGSEFYDVQWEQKYAELIVKECISIVEEQKECLCEEQQYWSDHDYGYEMAVNDASMGIKQFFGVEE